MADEGQRRRFEEVVLPHLDDALSLARWLTGNLSDAEDVVQEAALKAYQAIGSFRDGSPRAWLLAIVRNTAFSWLRKNRPKSLVVTDDIALLDEAQVDMALCNSAPNPEAALIAGAEAAQVQMAIAALPLNFREVLVLREIDGLSYREIADVVSLPIGTVMSRLSRARSMLLVAITQAQTARKGAA